GRLSGGATAPPSDAVGARLATGLLIALMVEHIVATVLNIVETSSGIEEWSLGAVITATGVCVLVCVLQLYHAPPAGGTRPQWWLWSLGSQGALVAALTAVFHFNVIPMIPFFAGSVLLLLRPRIAWLPLAAIAVGILAMPTPLNSSLIDRVTAVAFTVSIGLVVCAGSRLSDLTRQLEATNRVLVDRAAEAERLRIARDVHDLVCSNLFAIALKGELALKVMAEQPARSTEHLNELLHIAQRTLGDVRSLAGGPLQVSLSGEADSARALLAAAGIDGTVEVARVRLPAEVDQLLGVTLREAVTNVIRHTSARTCTVSIAAVNGSLSLHVVND
ncbi:sensor histidine kinase, partial [Phytoactinopolyspora endophytica]|uniref:sensor histidine kinase n=1 Tax=Phytoactinopolyspora endophytica TaxID=1642495 RepID=UPI0013EA2834